MITTTQLDCLGTQLFHLRFLLLTLSFSIVNRYNGVIREGNIQVLFEISCHSAGGEEQLELISEISFEV